MGELPQRKDGNRAATEVALEHPLFAEALRKVRLAQQAKQRVPRLNFGAIAPVKVR